MSKITVTNRFQVFDRKAYICTAPAGTVYKAVISSDMTPYNRSTLPLHTKGRIEAVLSATGETEIRTVGYDLYNSVSVWPKGEQIFTVTEDAEWWCVYNFQEHLEKWEPSVFTLQPGESKTVTLGGEGYILLCTGKLEIDDKTIVGPTTITFNGEKTIMATELAIGYMFKDKQTV